MSTPPPILHAVAESVKTEIIPCTVAAGIEGDLQIIRLGDVVIMSGNIFARKAFAGKTNASIGTVPADYRPAKEIGGVAICNYSAAYVTVKTNGEIVFLPSAASSGGSLYISAICWKIA